MIGYVALFELHLAIYLVLNSCKAEEGAEHKRLRTSLYNAVQHSQTTKLILQPTLSSGLCSVVTR